jgi:phosphoribosylformylglycinamidine synthase
MDHDVVHVNRFLAGKVFSDYEGLVIPGGFSFGDHVRAGALLGKILKEKFTSALLEFRDGGKPILGICNGFQVLVECGLLPGPDIPAALTTNLSSKFECRWVNLKVESTGCVFTKNIDRNISLPVAHGEGRFLAREKDLETLKKKRNIVIKYSLENGESAKEKYPENPNGSLADIAGVCDPSGIVFGLMPHPERAFYRYTHPKWTRNLEGRVWGDGQMFFKNMVDYIRKQ